MNTDTMPAGRKLDALVAEQVMGCKVWRNPVGSPYCRCDGPAHGHYLVEQLGVEVKSYSTDLAAAFEVAEKIALFRNCRYLHETRERVRKGSKRTLSDWYWEVEQVLYPLDNNVVIGRGKTAALAICRAALAVARDLKANGASW